MTYSIYVKDTGKLLYVPILMLPKLESHFVNCRTWNCPFSNFGYIRNNLFCLNFFGANLNFEITLHEQLGSNGHGRWWFYCQNLLPIQPVDLHHVHHNQSGLRTISRKLSLPCCSQPFWAPGWTIWSEDLQTHILLVMVIYFQRFTN